MIRFVVFLSIISGLSGSGAFCQSPQTRGVGNQHLLPINGVPTPIKGVNLAWLDGAYGHDFSVNPVTPEWKVSFNEKNLDRYFEDMKRMDVNVCRVWVFQALQGLVFDRNGYVSGLHPTLTRNFDTAVELAKKHDLHLYLTLACGFRDPIRKGGFEDIISDPKATAAYVNNALIPFVRRYEGNPTVFAIDLMNEPEGEISGPKGNRSKDGYSIKEVGRFLLASKAGVKRADQTRLVSCGSGWHGPENIKNGFYKDLDLDFYDFHEYRDDGYLPPLSELNVDKPVLVGECNQNNQKEVIDDQLQARAVAGFLESAQRHRYAGVLIWYYDHPNSRRKSGNFLGLLKANGSSEWRAGANVLQSFRFE